MLLLLSHHTAGDSTDSRHELVVEWCTRVYRVVPGGAGSTGSTGQGREVVCREEATLPWYTHPGYTSCTDVHMSLLDHILDHFWTRL